MKRLFALVFVALLFSVLSAGIKKTIYRDYGIVVFHPDSLISVRAHQIVWGNFWVIQSDSTDTMSMTPDKMTIDSITITDYLHCTDDVQFDSTLTFGSGAVFSQPHADTIILTEGNIILTGKIRAGSFGTPLDVTSNRVYGAELHYYGNNYNVTALRARAQFKTTDATGDTAIGALIQAANNDGINASVLNGAKIEAIGKATTTGARIGTMRGLLVNTEWSAKDTITDLRILHLRTHTRDATADGCVDGTSYGLYIENEAVGGNGQALDAGIYLDGTNLSAGNKAFTYGADFSGVATDIGTADFRFRSGGLIDNPDANTFTITEANIELDGDTWIQGDTLFLTDGGADTSSIFQDGNYLYIKSDNSIRFYRGKDVAQIGYTGLTIWGDLTVDDKAIFNDTVMLGDSADKIILPKGSAIELYDTTDTDKFEIYDTGTHSVFASVNPFTLNNQVWILNDTLFLTDGGADTSYVVNDGTYLTFGGDNDFEFEKTGYFLGSILGTNDAGLFRWDGWQLLLDRDNDAQLAYISFHAEDSIKVDTTSATGHRLSWTGAGGMEIRDGTGADSARWYDDGTHTTFTTDNDFVLSDDVTLGDTINTILLPKATRLIFTDSSGVDSTILLNDGTKLSITSDNQITLGNQNVYINPGDTLFIASATFTEFAIYASGDALYIHGAGGDNIHLVTGDVYVDCDLHVDDVYFDGNINDQFAYQCAGDIFNIATNSVLILGWISPATTEQDLSPHNHDATYQGTMTTADQIAKGLVWKLDFDATDDYLSVIDHADFTFDDAGAARGFTMGGWIEVVATATNQVILSKWDEHTDGDPELREWKLWIDAAEKLNLRLADESVYAYEGVITDDALSVGWHLVSAVYNGVGGVGASAGIAIYVDGVSVAVTLVDNGVYAGMEDLATIVMVGAHKATDNTVDDFFQGDLGHIFITTDQLTADESWELYLRTRGYYNE